MRVCVCPLCVMLMTTRHHHHMINAAFWMGCESMLQPHQGQVHYNRHLRRQHMAHGKKAKCLGMYLWWWCVRSCGWFIHLNTLYRRKQMGAKHR